MVRLGAWSAILLVLALQCLVLACALYASAGNRRANRALSALMVVIAGLLTPFILGYAGAYDALPWLTYAPFAVPLAVGPLLFAYVRALTDGLPLRRWHWLAPFVQFGWQAAAFWLSPGAKDRLDAIVIEPFVAPLSDAGVLLSMALYGVASWRMVQRYDGWLAGRRRSRRPAARLRAMILILMPLVAARAGYSLFEALVRPIDYYDLFGYYLLLGGSALLLGITGWRRSGEGFPVAIDEASQWRRRGEEWIERLRDAGWWRSPELDLDGLARLLGTNRSNLSLALSDHGGFAAVVGTIRSEAVAAEIERGSAVNLLQTALDCGFGSKASFNRAFRARFGVSPSVYRGGSTHGASAIQTD